MLVELKNGSQITIPSEIIKSLGLSEGDKFDVEIKDGGIFLRPVVVYPKEKMDEIAKLIKKAEAEAENQTAFASVDDMLADMGIDIDLSLIHI